MYPYANRIACVRAPPSAVVGKRLSSGQTAAVTSRRSRANDKSRRDRAIEIRSSGRPINLPPERDEEKSFDASRYSARSPGDPYFRGNRTISRVPDVVVTRARALHRLVVARQFSSRLRLSTAYLHFHPRSASVTRRAHVQARRPPTFRTRLLNLHLLTHSLRT